MPRQDVPYGGAICRLKERIAEIWDKLGEKLHSVNGVTGDAAGDVKIVSGDAAITISESQVEHYIEIGLDHGELPNAAVTSVNGESGAVTLGAADIPSDGGSDVQRDIDDLQDDVNANVGAIAAEAMARADADSALQGNINSVQASIPGAAATAVANDPTVTQLATDVPNKVDKIVSGSSLKAYTHTGATQGETSVVDGTAANSIGVRDANGRMQAADPASGATDKTLVTANWVSQTGAGKPNNLIHDSGNETFNGQKIANSTCGFRTPFKRDEVPASTMNSPSIIFTDSNNHNCFQTITSKESNGNMRVYFTLFNTVNGTVKSATLRFSLTADGQTSLQIIDSNGRYHMIASY